MKTWQELYEMAKKINDDGDTGAANKLMELALVRRADSEAFAGLPVWEFAFSIHCGIFMSKFMEEPEQESDEYKNWLNTA